MADEAEQDLEFAPHPEEPEQGASPEPVGPPRRSTAALVFALVGLGLLVWFFVLLFGHSQDWRDQGEKWAGLETEQWMYGLAALFIVVLVVEAVILFRRISSRSGEYVGSEQAPRNDDDAVVVGEAERGALR